MLLLIAILLFVVLLGLYSVGVAWHRRRLKREAERSAVWAADEALYSEDGVVAGRWWKPETWEQFYRKLDYVIEAQRYQEYEYDCDIKTRFTFVIYAGSLLESV